jgi:hypothetical protein
VEELIENTDDEDRLRNGVLRMHPEDIEECLRTFEMWEKGYIEGLVRDPLLPTKYKKRARKRHASADPELVPYGYEVVGDRSIPQGEVKWK